MLIAALSPNAVRVIGSSQVLTDPCSVVKELVDNALDARATSIFVEISLNTLDIIQVKDNGYGIGPEDRAMVCKRSCTSKIRNLEDLKDIGGRSLGFRGEALASAADLSGSLLVTTRVEGELVAASLRIDRNGEVQDHAKVSHPVGTTVRVADFLKYLPVRRQTALKTAPRTLVKIKQTMQAYAIARPSTRLSLKVLKAKNEKGNWMYAPNAGASVLDAGTKVVGKNILAHCQWISWCSSETRTPALDTTRVVEDRQDEEGVNAPYWIEALVPKPDADASVISNAGNFISIDSRPVTCTRGLLKQLITMYKRYIRSVWLTNAAKITDPFLCMNIVCPTGSYDANVEPAKDDVLFVDQSRLLSILETFFKLIYGDLEVTGDRDLQKTASQHRSTAQKGFDVLLARKPLSTPFPSIDIPTIETNGHAEKKTSTQTEPHVDANAAIDEDKQRTETDELAIGSVTTSRFEESGHTSQGLLGNISGEHDEAGAQPSLDLGSIWHFSMHGGDEEIIEELDDMSMRLTEDDSMDQEGLKDVSVSNPWTIAKMNNLVRPGRKEQDCVSSDIFENAQLMTPARENIGHSMSTIHPTSEVVIRNRVTVNPQTPRGTLRSPSPNPGDVSSSARWHYPSKAWGSGRSDLRHDKTKAQAPERDMTGSLDSWISNSPRVRRPDEAIEDRRLTQGLLEDDETDRPVPSQPANANGFISARNLQQGTQLKDIPDAPPKRNLRLGLRGQHGQGAIHKPFVPPVNDPTKVWFEMAPQRRARVLPQTQSQSVRSGRAPVHFESETEDLAEPSKLDNPTTPFRHPTQVDLEGLMDYEYRKSAATRAYKSSLNNQAITGSATPNNERVDKGSLSSVNSPYKNRYEAAKAALNPFEKDSNERLPVFADGDPRAYLIRVRKREEESAQRDFTNLGGPGHRLRRARTAMLPLETIAADRRVQQLVLDVSTDVPSLKKREVEAMNTDEYVRIGAIPCGLMTTVSDSDVQSWQQKLSNILNQTCSRAGSGHGTEETSLNFSPALRQHLLAHT